MTLTLVRTKFNRSHLSRDIIQRSVLVQRLNDGLDRSLTLVSYLIAAIRQLFPEALIHAALVPGGAIGSLRLPQGIDFEIISTNLSKEEKDQLRATFSAE